MSSKRDRERAYKQLEAWLAEYAKETKPQYTEKNILAKFVGWCKGKVKSSYG